MPVIFALDVSLSMFTPLEPKLNSDTMVSACLAGIAAASDYLVSTYRNSVEIAIVHFSRSAKLVQPFSRNVSPSDPLKPLSENSYVGINKFVSGINGIVAESWSSWQTITLIVVTDQGVFLDGLGEANLINKFNFPVKLHVIVVSSTNLCHHEQEDSEWERLVSAHDGSLHSLSVSSSSNSAAEFSRFAAENLQFPAGIVQLGSLSVITTIYPDSLILSSSKSFTLEIRGFMSANSEIFSGEVETRHLLLFREPSQTPNFVQEHRPSSLLSALFAVLKQEKAVGICLLKEYDDRYAIIHVSSPVSQTKKHQNLCLALLKPGRTPIPWLGPIPSLTLSALAPSISKPPPPRKKSYNEISSFISWGKTEGLKSDVHRILRLAKRLPDKSTLFLKELNKLRSASLILGTSDLLNIVSSALSREANSSSNPEGKNMLLSCADQLQSIKDLEVDVTYIVKKS